MHYLLDRSYGSIPIIYILATTESGDLRLKPIFKINYFSQQRAKILE